MLVAKPYYAGPFAEEVQAWAGNVAVSFALYFAAVGPTAGRAHGRLVAALATLGAVTAFELTNGFGVTPNVYDPGDLIANAVGVSAAFAVDVAWERVSSERRAARG